MTAPTANPAAASVTPPPVDKSNRPVPGPPRSYHFPHFERRRIDNGLSIVVAPVTKLPVVTVSVLVDAGSVSDPAGREGTAQLTAKLMIEGTAASDGGELTERVEQLGASLEAAAGWDMAAVTMTVLSQHLDQAFDLLGEVILTPAFRAREVERIKAERLAELLQLRAEPGGLADELFARFLYVPGSRYARPAGGDETTVDGIEREHIQEFYRSRYLPGNATVVIAGDVSIDRAEALVRRTLGNWTGGAPTAATGDDGSAHASRGVHIIAKSDAPQSELRIGHVGVRRDLPDFFPVNVMNAVLGGLFNSRINLNLREVHGYTYGAFSGFEWRRQAGPFVVSTAVKSDITDAAAREVFMEIDRIRTTPISPDELSLATSYMDGVFPIRFETTEAIAAALSVLVLFGLPEDYYDRYRENVRAVTVEDVLSAARTYLHPDRLQTVVVGDPVVVRDPLGLLDVGPITLYDTQGRRIDDRAAPDDVMSADMNEPEIGERRVEDRRKSGRETSTT